MRERRFTEKEASEIVRRAVQAQGGHARQGSDEGIGELELRSAARELGIDDAAFDLAVDENERDLSVNKPGLFGGPFRQESEVILDGLVDDATWEQIVAEIRRTYGEAGKVEKRGTTYEWQGTGGGLSGATLTITQGEKNARLRVSSMLEGLAVIPYLLGLLPLFVGVAVLAKMNLPYEVALAFLNVLLPALAARQLGTHWARQHHQGTTSLVGKIKRAVAQDRGSLRDNLSQRVATPMDEEDNVEEVEG